MRAGVDFCKHIAYNIGEPRSSFCGVSQPEVRVLRVGFAYS